MDSEQNILSTIEWMGVRARERAKAKDAVNSKCFETNESVCHVRVVNYRLIDIALLEYGAFVELSKNRRKVSRQKAARKSTL